MQQEQPNSIVLKLKHGDDIRRIRLDNPAQVSFEELQALIVQLFPALDLASITLKYEDDEGDALSITSQLEWAEALRPFLNKERLGVLTLTFTSLSKMVDEGETEDDAGPEISLVFSPCFGRPQQTFSCSGARSWDQCFRSEPQQHEASTTEGAIDETGGRCTFNQTGRRYAPHSIWFNCLTCGLVGGEGCCLPCAERCHKGHALLERGSSPGFFCDCGAGQQCAAQSTTTSHSSPTPSTTIEEEGKGKEKESEQENESGNNDGMQVEEGTSASESRGGEEEAKRQSELMGKLQFLQSMGFLDHTRNMAALSHHNGDVNGAVAALLNNIC